jgi:protein-L-isoaspartate(D-aspartate) O-methyltransferase
MLKTGVLILIWIMAAVSNAQNNFEDLRNDMVNYQLKARDITDNRTLTAMRSVKRHEFVPKHIQHLAYTDGPLSIGYGQTISQPYIVAYMTQVLKLKPEHRVLEIGTGSGYQAAVLAEIVDTVYTIEIVKPLAQQAKECFARLGYTNIIAKAGDGYHGWPEHAPFDAVIVTAGVNAIPPALLDQLAEGGRMVIPAGSMYQKHLVLVTKNNGKIKQQKLLAVAFVPFTREEN